MGRKFRNHMGFIEEEPPEWAEKWAMTNPIVYNYYRLWRRGDCSWEQMLVDLTKKLLEINQLQSDELLRLKLCENTVLVMADGTRRMYVGPKPKIKEESTEKERQKDE